MRSTSRFTLLALAALAVGGTASTYALHKNDICISKGRRLSDKEIFLEAMAGVRGFDSYSNPIGQSRGAYLDENTDPENLQILMVRESGASEQEARPLLPSEESEERFRRDFRAEDYKHRQQISKLLDDPDYRKRCCTWVDRDGENASKEFTVLDTLIGKSYKIVRVRLDHIKADPSAFSPPVERRLGKDGEWQATASGTKVQGGNVQRNESHFYVHVNVCGLRDVDYS